MFDAKFGTETQEWLELGDLGVSSQVREHAVRYEPSSILKARRALRHLGVQHPRFEFIDLGSGKGLVALLAAQYAFRRVVGVEVSAILHRRAQDNLARYSRRAAVCAPVELINADATDYEFGDADKVVYFYNPFDAEVLSRIVTRLIALPPATAVVVAYVNPVHRDVIERVGRFEPVFDDGSTLVVRRI